MSIISLRLGERSRNHPGSHELATVARELCKRLGHAASDPLFFWPTEAQEIIHRLHGRATPEDMTKATGMLALWDQYLKPTQVAPLEDDEIYTPPAPVDSAPRPTAASRTYQPGPDTDAHLYALDELDMGGLQLRRPNTFEHLTPLSEILHRND